MISFIIPYRDREKQLEGLLANLEAHYSSLDYEVLVVIQEDDRPFLRGQLFNLGFQRSRGEILVLQDVDLRFFSPFPFVETIQRIDRCILPYDVITQIDELGPNKFHQGVSQARTNCGGICFLRRQRFIESNGFSNLIIGWGAEDNLFANRVMMYRVTNTMGHITHHSTPGDKSLLWARYIKNFDIVRTEQQRDPIFDSYRETDAESIKVEYLDPHGKIRIYRFANIGVIEGFKYQDLLINRDTMTIGEIKASLIFSPIYAFKS